MSTYEKLRAIDCSAHIEKKGRFSYLSWAWAWDTLKSHCPDATFEKHVFGGKPYMIDEQGYAFVMVSVFVEGQTATEIMPVLNHQNKPIQNPNAFDVNTALQRCLTKAVAFHGLGLYIYAGEDLPPDVKPEPVNEQALADLKALCEEKGADFAAVESWINSGKGTIDDAIANLEKR